MSSKSGQQPLQRQVRGHLTLPHNTIFTVTSDDKEEVVKAFKKVSGDDGIEFNQVDPATVAIFHSHWNNGHTPMGYINEIRVPNNLSVQDLTEHRLQEAKAA